MGNLATVVCRVLFAVAFVLAGLAILEKLLRLVGYTILLGTYQPGRLLEFSAVVLLFVIALLLRDVRDLLEAKRP